MKEFKIGDKVKLKENEFDWYNVKGLIGTVIQTKVYCEYTGPGHILVEFEKEVWCGHSGDGRGKNKHCLYFLPESLEKINSSKKLIFTSSKKLIFTGNKTIYINGRNKFIAECNKEDNFDKEKGLLFCIAKEAGYTYNDIKNLIKNSIDNLPVEVNRKAKIGDYIKITKSRCSFGCYKNNDILYVTDIRDKSVYCKNIDVLIYDDEYVVLENYKPENKKCATKK